MDRGFVFAPATTIAAAYISVFKFEMSSNTSLYSSDKSLRTLSAASILSLLTAEMKTKAY